MASAPLSSSSSDSPTTTTTATSDPTTSVPTSVKHFLEPVVRRGRNPATRQVKKEEIKKHNLQDPVHFTSSFLRLSFA